jgi:hypothetical protein
MIDKPVGGPYVFCQASNGGVGVVGNSDSGLFAQLPGIRSACEESHLIRSMRRRQPALWGQKEKAYVQSRGRRLRYPQPRKKTAHPRINRVALSLIICPPPLIAPPDVPSLALFVVQQLWAHCESPICRQYSRPTQQLRQQPSELNQSFACCPE